jgi:hypothetical protein
MNINKNEREMWDVTDVTGGKLLDLRMKNEKTFKSLSYLHFKTSYNETHLVSE